MFWLATISVVDKAVHDENCPKVKLSKPEQADPYINL